jgi:hypothetical protein
MLCRLCTKKLQLERHMNASLRHHLLKVFHIHLTVCPDLNYSLQLTFKPTKIDRGTIHVSWSGNKKSLRHLICALPLRDWNSSVCSVIRLADSPLHLRQHARRSAENLSSPPEVYIDCAQFTDLLYSSPLISKLNKIVPALDHVSCPARTKDLPRNVRCVCCERTKRRTREIKWLLVLRLAVISTTSSSRALSFSWIASYSSLPSCFLWAYI